jgi:hypothetical protein
MCQILDIGNGNYQIQIEIENDLEYIISLIKVVRIKFTFVPTARQNQNFFNLKIRNL